MASIGWQRASRSPGVGDTVAGGTGPRTGAFGPPAGRRIRTRRELPSRRAALGALLVTASAAAAFAVANAGDGAPSTRYVVTSRALPPGSVLGPADVRLVALDLPADQAASALTDAAVLDGAVLRGPVAAGALLTDAVLQPAGAGAELRTYREVSFAVPRARALLGDLAPGDRVDVVATVEDRSAVLVQRALVIDADGSSDDLLAGDDVVITLALTDGTDALAVVHGAAAGSLTVLRSTRATDELPAAFPAATAPAGQAS